METKGETKGKNITHPRLLKQLNPEKMTTWGGGLPLTGFKYSHKQKRKRNGKWRRRKEVELIRRKRNGKGRW